MLNSEKKVTIELLNKTGEKTGSDISLMSNPVKNTVKADKLALMVRKILNEEIPKLKHNSLLYNLVLFTVTEKMKTVQTVENVLSYIKENNISKIHDISIENGEIHIKCSD